MIVAHRGASHDAPENTLAAFNLAWHQGVDAIEGDVQLTKDGVIVCFHDKNTIRVTDQNRIVSQSTLTQLRELQVDNQYSVDCKDVYIPTIAEVFATVPQDKKIYIEIKSGIEIIPALLDEINKANITKQQMVILCFSLEVVYTIKSQTEDLHVLWLAHITRNAEGLLTPSVDCIIKQLRLCKADAFSSNYEYVDEYFVKEIIAMGYDYHVWTVNDLQTAQLFIDWGAKSITSDIAGYFKRHLPK